MPSVSVPPVSHALRRLPCLRPSPSVSHPSLPPPVSSSHLCPRLMYPMPSHSSIFVSVSNLPPLSPSLSPIFSSTVSVSSPASVSVSSSGLCLLPRLSSPASGLRLLKRHRCSRWNDPVTVSDSYCRRPPLPSPPCGRVWRLVALAWLATARPTDRTAVCGRETPEHWPLRRSQRRCYEEHKTVTRAVSWMSLVVGIWDRTCFGCGVFRLAMEIKRNLSQILNQCFLGLHKPYEAVNYWGRALRPSHRRNQRRNANIQTLFGRLVHRGASRGSDEKHYIFRVSSVKLRDLHFWILFFEDFCYVGGLRKPAAW